MGRMPPARARVVVALCLAAVLAVLAMLGPGSAAWLAAAAAPAGEGAAGAVEKRAGAGEPAAAGGTQLEKETRAREVELAALRVEIARLEARLDQARQQQQGVEGEMAAADLALELEQKRLAEATVARDQAAQREAASEAEVKQLESTLEARRRDFQRQLAGLYRLGRQGYLRLFFLLKPGTGLVPSIRLMRYLVRRDREAVDHYQAAKDRLALRRDQLAGERRDSESWLGLEQTRRHELVAARQRKAAVLARLQRERSDLATRAAALADRERKLASFLDLLYGTSTTALAGTPMQQFRGILEWPAQGQVTERFGPRLDPRYRTQTPHNGIDLATTAGAEVKVVYPGKVLYAAPFEGYGLTAVVHHPGRVFTLYAGLAELQKAKDDMVSLGETVGLASDRLYFEIRVENRPEDPLSWLH
jgi:septal ring factor EnvC (AmiA/AmiB activator)